MSAPTPLQTVGSIIRGYLPRVFQARGWVIGALPLVAVSIGYLMMAVAPPEDTNLQHLDLKILHHALFLFIIPIMALLTAPAGIREDLEQRTLPLMLSRPVQVWVLPFAKGLLWWAWGSIWLIVTAICLGGLGAEVGDIPKIAVAIVGIFGAELAFLTLFGLVFKRGNLWGALWLFAVNAKLVRILPGTLQRLTFPHYAESLAESRASDINASHLLAQAQVETPWVLALLILLAFTALCWGLSGWRLHTKAVGLAGAEGEG